MSTSRLRTSKYGLESCRSAPSDLFGQVLAKLGVKMTTKPAKCTHLVAHHIVPTEKFLCVMSVAPFIVAEGWITDSVAAKRILRRR
jgi:mediator of DNA damage checkpoint protein 1